MHSPTSCTYTIPIHARYVHAPMHDVHVTNHDLLLQSAPTSKDESIALRALSSTRSLHIAHNQRQLISDPDASLVFAGGQLNTSARNAGMRACSWTSGTCTLVHAHARINACMRSCVGTPYTSHRLTSTMRWWLCFVPVGTLPAATPALCIYPSR